MTSTIELDLQAATKDIYFPTEDQFKMWAENALNGAIEYLSDELSAEQPLDLPYDFDEPLDLTIRVVDPEEIQQLNSDYRGKDQPTNILSFPFEQPEFVQVNLLGDLIICSPIIASEARDQEKKAKSHWAHMVTHGVLHLLGFDHQEDQEAERMETLEINILAKIGIPNPYE